MSDPNSSVDPANGSQANEPAIETSAAETLTAPAKPPSSPEARSAAASRRKLLKVAAATAGGVLATGLAINKRSRPTSTGALRARHHAGEIPIDPTDKVWARPKARTVPLAIQNLVPQHAPDLAVAELQVRALHNGEQIGFQVSWADAEQDSVDAMAKFRDAVAVQLPVDPASTPAVTMGAATQPVHILQWRASWQVDVDLGHQGVKDIFPNMYHDAPPEALAGEDAARIFYPARYLGNPMARRDRSSPVEDLVAGGFGSLTSQEVQTADGRGVYEEGRWSVTLITPMAGGEGKTALEPGLKTVVAFAVWNGSHGNRGSRKQWSNWTELEIEAGS